MSAKILLFLGGGTPPLWWDGGCNGSCALGLSASGVYMVHCKNLHMMPTNILTVKCHILEIILDIIETICLCNYHKKPAIILLIDFSKAFDSISHAYIYEALIFFILKNTL